MLYWIFSFFYTREMLRLSRSLVKLLRHTSRDRGLFLSEDASLSLNDIRTLSEFKDLSWYVVYFLSFMDTKNRFGIFYKNGEYRVQAFQGHSHHNAMGVTGHLKRLTLEDTEMYPVVIHGTKYSVLSRMKPGLSRMNRQHIHFSSGIPGSGILSGARSDCQIFIYLDIWKTISEGIPVYLSKNNVILTPGVDESGILPLEYISKITSRLSGKEISY